MFPLNYTYAFLVYDNLLGLINWYTYTYSQKKKLIGKH